MSEPEPQAPQREDAIARIVALLDEADTTMLTTVQADGRLVARPMAFVPGAFDGVLWLFADEASPEVLDISARPSVNATFSMPSRGDWVSLSGDAHIVRDDDRARSLWDDRLESWFVDGVATAGLVLISVDVELAEYWDGPGPAQSLVGSLRAALTRSADDRLLDIEHRSIEL